MLNAILNRTFLRLLVAVILVVAGPNSWAQTDSDIKQSLETLIQRVGSDSTQNPADAKKTFTDLMQKYRSQEIRKIEKESKSLLEELQQRQKEFIQMAKTDKERFFAGKPSAEEKREFNSQQAQERKKFFEDQRLKRQDIQSQSRDKKNNFKIAMKQLTDQFDEKLMTAQNLWKKNQEAKELLRKQQADSRREVLKNLDEEFSSLQKKKPIQLKTQD